MYRIYMNSKWLEMNPSRLEALQETVQFQCPVNCAKREKSFFSPGFHFAPKNVVWARKNWPGGTTPGLQSHPEAHALDLSLSDTVNIPGHHWI